MRRLVRASAGFTLLELLLAGAIFLVIVLALGSLYLTTTRAFNLGSAQAFVQRQGTLIEEELARQILPATQVQASPTPPAPPTTQFCGPAGSVPPAGKSMIFQRGSGALSTFWCVYELQDTSLGDLFPQLYLCQVGGVSPLPQTCTGTKRNLLAGAIQIVAGSVRSALRVSNSTFTKGIDPGGVDSPRTVDIRFDLDDGTLFSPLQFGLSVTFRN